MRSIERLRAALRVARAGDRLRAARAVGGLCGWGRRLHAGLIDDGVDESVVAFAETLGRWRP